MDRGQPEFEEHRARSSRDADRAGRRASCARSASEEGRGGAWRRLTSPSRCSATARSARPSTGCSPSAPTTSSARPATGCESCKALVRDPDKERDFPPADGVLTTDFARRSRDDPSIAVVAEVMGGVEPTGDYVLELLRARQARRLREQAARRAARRRALRGRVGGGRAAPLRGERLRGDPGDQGAARVARRHERPPRARDRQRDDELHPHRDGGGQHATTRRSRRRSALRLRRGRSDRRRLAAPTRPRRWRSSRRSRSARASTLDDVDVRRASTRIDAARRRGRARARHGRPARRRRRRSSTAASTSASARRSSTATIRSPRSTARSTPSCSRATRSARSRSRGPGAGGIETASAVVADMVSVIGTTGHGLPPERRRAGATLERLPPGELPLAVLRPPRRRRPARRARARRRRLAEHEVSIARLAAAPRTATAPRSHVVTHEAPRGRARGRARRRSRRSHEVRAPARGAAGDLRPRRRGARMGVIERYRDRLPVAGDADRDARRGLDAAAPRAAALGAARASSSG